MICGKNGFKLGIRLKAWIRAVREQGSDDLHTPSLGCKVEQSRAVQPSGLIGIGAFFKQHEDELVIITRQKKGRNISIHRIVDTVVPVFFNQPDYQGSSFFRRVSLNAGMFKVASCCIEISIVKESPNERAEVESPVFGFLTRTSDGADEQTIAFPNGFAHEVTNGYIACGAVRLLGVVGCTALFPVRTGFFRIAHPGQQGEGHQAGEWESFHT